MTQTSLCCWGNLSPEEFPLKNSITETVYVSSAFSIKSLNVFCFNVEKSCLHQFRSIVDESVHTIYSLSDSDWINNRWQLSTALLIVSDCLRNGDHSEEIKKVNDFIANNNGKVLLLLSNDCHHLPNKNGFYHILNSMEAFSFQSNSWTWRKIGQNLCLTNSQNVPVLVVANNAHNEVNTKSMCSALNLLGISYVNDSVPQPSLPVSSDFLLYCKPVDMACPEEFDNLRKLLADEIKGRIAVVPLENAEEPFSFSDFQSSINLASKLGRNVFWADVLPSSFTICQRILSKLPKQSGLVLVSAIQTSGVGRGNNRWISPRGMACFTLHFDLPLSEGDRSCEIPHVLSWIQHLSSIAVLQTLEELIDLYTGKNETDVEIRIKWPNDVYAIDKATNIGTKIAGALSTATVSNTTGARCLVGIGINVANSKPTKCLHDLIRDHAPGSNLPSVATVIGRTIGHLEKLIGQLERGNTKVIQNLYTSSWMHSGQKIRGLDANRLIECTIVGVDEFGYLRAVEDEKGKEITLRPDGNSIDMTSGTIISLES